MYLKAEIHTSGYSFVEERERETYDGVVNAVRALPFADKESPTAEISINVGYWRKANAIHGWFVNECQEGVDECQKSYVPRDKLQELMELCKEVLINKDRAEELLPVT